MGNPVLGVHSKRNRRCGGCTCKLITVWLCSVGHVSFEYQSMVVRGVVDYYMGSINRHYSLPCEFDGVLCKYEYLSPAIGDNETEVIYFVRTKDEGWFSLGWWAGRLDFDGSLTKKLNDYLLGN